MRKILSVLCASILLVSCSNNSDEELSVDSGQKYKVSLNIVNNFVIQSQVLKASDVEWPYRYICEYTIYKDNGEVVDHKVLNEPLLEFELPKGNYKIAVLAARDTEYQGNSYFQYSDLATDYCGGNHWISKSADNAGMYYEITDFSVSESENNAVDVELEPMWSELNVTVTDAATCFLPEQATPSRCTIYVGVEPYYYGFALKDKIPTRKMDEYPVPFTLNGVLFEDFRSGGILQTCYMAQGKDITVKLIYMEATESQTKVLGERIIYRGDFEPGKRYELVGALGDDAINGTIGFNVTLGKLGETDPIPFN